ncbi:hypothetical protein HD806DRAFT_514628, partial [Xylariaceae sp. AK1471]
MECRLVLLLSCLSMAVSFGLQSRSALHPLSCFFLVLVLVHKRDTDIWICTSWPPILVEYGGRAELVPICRRLPIAQSVACHRVGSDQFQQRHLRCKEPASETPNPLTRQPYTSPLSDLLRWLLCSSAYGFEL